MNPPANAASPCSDLAEIAEGATMGDLMQFTKYLVDEYTICAMKHDALIAAK